MMDKEDRQARLDEIRKADQAKSFLENEVLQSTVAAITKRYTDAWRNSTVEDKDGREKLWLMLKSLDTLMDDMNSMVITGQLSQKQFENEKRESQS